MFNFTIIWLIVDLCARIVRLCTSCWKQMRDVTMFAILFTNKEITTSIFFNNSTRLQKASFSNHKNFLMISLHILFINNIITCVCIFIHNKLFLLSIWHGNNVFPWFWHQHNNQLYHSIFVSIIYCIIIWWCAKFELNKFMFVTIWNNSIQWIIVSCPKQLHVLAICLAQLFDHSHFNMI